MDYAFDYMQDYGVTDESNYPYTAEDSYECYNDRISNGFSISSYNDVADDQNSLVAAIARQPVSIAINAMPIQLYDSGIFNDWSCGDHVHHGVLAVGYGTDYSTGQDYWLVKNSWGTNWGENGYVRIKMGTCGIEKSVSKKT